MLGSVLCGRDVPAFGAGGIFVELSFSGTGGACLIYDYDWTSFFFFFKIDV